MRDVEVNVMRALEGARPERRSASEVERRTLIVRSLDSLLRSVSATVLVGLTFSAIDLGRRSLGHRTPDLPQGAATVVLFVGVASLLGCILHLGLLAEGALHRLVAERRPRLALGLRAALAALIAAALSWSIAFWVFGGARVRTSGIARFGPWLILTGLGTGAALLALAVHVGRNRFVRGERVVPMLVTLSLLGVAASFVAVDLTLYVSLYARLHSLLEAMASLCVLAAIWVLMPAARPAWWVRVLGACSLAWVLVAWLIPRPRAWVERSLRGVWVEPVYAGRMVSRVHALRAYLDDPQRWQGTAASGVERLKAQYDVENSTLAPLWTTPPEETPDQRAALAKMRGGGKRFNVAIFYVDTLRYDVASDPDVMPNVSAFFRESIHFSRAYAAGSDTLRSLPAITRGTYLAGTGRERDFLEVARDGGWRRALVIPQSANEFLDKESPDFGFDEKVIVDDYAPVRTDVWGYGADDPAAEHVVDRSLDWMKQNQERPFVLWSFHFDQHNWRELNDRHVALTARTFSMPEGDGMKRYAVVARGIDVQFGRFLRGLDQLGLRDETIVVFLSDHGEGVGRDGFWVHSIFLWDVLLRVPLALRVPGRPPAVVDTPVSLVDLAPTLARWFDPRATMGDYQGEDLLLRLLPGAAKRRRPILLLGGSREATQRIGVIAPAGGEKLIVQLESGVPELYDLSASDPDWKDLSQDRPQSTLRLLNQLVRSPVFPRAAEGAEGDRSGPE